DNRTGRTFRKVLVPAGARITERALLARRFLAQLVEQLLAAVAAICSSSGDESVGVLLDGMRWLGLTWDEGPDVGGPHAPYFQMQRLATYDKHADVLIAKGRAYRCDCSKELLDKLREEAAREKRAFRYPGTCRNKNLPKGTPGSVVRFRIPDEGATTFKDLVKGEITTQHKELQDEVILRADGVPLYNFGAVVDDIEMGITMVARGDDDVVNTARQIRMYQA